VLEGVLLFRPWPREYLVSGVLIGVLAGVLPGFRHRLLRLSDRWIEARFPASNFMLVSRCFAGRFTRFRVTGYPISGNSGSWRNIGAGSGYPQTWGSPFGFQIYAGSLLKIQERGSPEKPGQSFT
jgi:hypothetical protein